MANEALSDVTSTPTVSAADEFYALVSGNSRRVSFLNFLNSADLAPTAPLYDAIGDGVAADQAALTALSDSGAAAVYIPTGTYLLNSNATFEAGQRVIIDDATFTGAGILSQAGVSDLSLLSSSYHVETLLARDYTTGAGWHYSFTQTSGTATGDLEQDGLLVIATTYMAADGNEAGVVGVGARAYIPGSNSDGRAFGLNAYARIASGGDGALWGIEINLENNGSDNSTPNTALAKYGLNITTKPGSNPGTAAIMIGNTSDFHEGFYAEQASFVSSSSNFIRLKDYFTVTAAGLVTAVDLTLNRGAGSATPGSSLFQEYQNSGSTLFGQRLGASNSYWHFDRYYSAAWSRVLTVQRSTGNFGIGVDPTEALQVAGNARVSGHYKVGANQVVGAQGAAVADASGGATVDTEARTALNALLARVRSHGLIAT